MPENIAELRCLDCGRPPSLEGQSPGIRRAMISRRLCRECLKWHLLMDLILERNNVRIGGIQYIVKEDPTGDQILMDDGTLVRVSLKRIGRVPPHLADKLADNAVLITEGAGSDFPS